MLDLSLARNIRLGGGRNIQLRVDMFNAPNQAIITGRATNLSLSNPNDPVTNQAPVFDPTTGLLNNGVNLLPNGTLSPNRSQPKNDGVRRRPTRTRTRGPCRCRFGSRSRDAQLTHATGG